jgi:hypothetical protein
MFSKTIGFGAGLCLCMGGICGLPHLSAQSTAAALNPPPKVLVIDVENLKPGTSASAHQNTENAFVTAAQKSKVAEHYMALDALSGPPRTLFFLSYDSFAAFEKQHQQEMGDATFTADIDHAQAADGELLSAMSRSVYTLRDDLSHNAPCSIATMRYMQISRITIRAGHQPEFEEYLKMFDGAIEKTEPGRHVAVYQSEYGWENGGVWLIITPMKSLDEVDSADADSAKFRENMGDANMKHYRELAASAIQSGQRNLFAFDPAMSYVPDAWVSADPFWKHK